MPTFSTICLNFSTVASVSPALPCCPQLLPTAHGVGKERKQREVTVFAAKSGGFPLNSIFKKCETCNGKRAIECPGCKGTGKNKKNGNIFERWKDLVSRAALSVDRAA
ncbi:hypothetical protein SAY86_023020 [Trapa natans]|uniref:Uncharacterized protein n=1 Tax=Trapa natans TaxID=22666 RepID=A0AAN7LUE3_TRANT|nr:hypothetical protein SAY86_023020 [Trapa natans]